MSSPAGSWAQDADRFGQWGDERLYGQDRLDDWSYDEWWRAQNPGASLMRGLLWAVPISTAMWAGAALLAWMVLSR